jgi:hypothetical protein
MRCMIQGDGYIEGPIDRLPKHVLVRLYVPPGPDNRGFRKAHPDSGGFLRGSTEPDTGAPTVFTALAR